MWSTADRPKWQQQQEALNSLAADCLMSPNLHPYRPIVRASPSL